MSEDAPAVGDAGASSVSKVTVEREAESPRASAPSTREVYAAASEEEPSKGRAADVPKLDAEQPARGLESRARELESKAFRGDGARGGAVRDTGELPALSEVESGGAARQFASSSASQHSALPQESQPLDSAAIEEKRGRVARVREGTRARVENTRARVERVKDDALVALEETTDDSGLRFVAVAVFLFALTLLFLFLSVSVLR
jgi:hypothetical protein